MRCLPCMTAWPERVNVRQKTMRYIDPEQLKERKNKVLQAIIHQYIKTAKPVGSHTITHSYGFEFSPATIRNLMAELEDDGYLTHPHTSAGRVPTDKGYRNYVDSLIELQKMVVEEVDNAQQEYDNRMKALHDVLTETSRVLSALSHFTGFVVTPKRDTNLLKYIELIQISPEMMMVIFVTHTGLVQHKVVEVTVPREKLTKLNKLLNEKLHDITLSNVQQQIFKILDDFEREQTEIVNLARNLSRQMFNLEEEIYFEGTRNVLELPEFHDYESMRCILNLNEDKARMIQMLHEHISQDEVSVLIGSETSCDNLKQLSVVGTIYKDGDRPVGILGIIGPKRMEYPRMMALVSAVSKVVNKLLARGGSVDGY